MAAASDAANALPAGGSAAIAAAPDRLAIQGGGSGDRGDGFVRVKMEEDAEVKVEAAAPASCVAAQSDQPAVRRPPCCVRVVSMVGWCRFNSGLTALRLRY
jgi:hypothetical protein